MKRLDRPVVRALGLGLIVTGFVLFIFSPFGGRDLSCAPFPSSYPGGCPLPPGYLFISGIGLIIGGVIVLILARGVKADPKTDSVESS